MVVPCVMAAVMASTMPKQWNIGTWIIMPVGRGEIHAVADGLAVVDHVVVGEHDALGEARGAGGILHVAHVVLVDGGACGGTPRSAARASASATASSQVKQPGCCAIHA